MPIPTGRSAVLLALALALAACAGARRSGAVDSGWSGTDGGPPACALLEQQMASTLDAAGADPSVTSQPSFTVLLEAEDGRRFSFWRGESSPSTRYESASTSKLVTAVVLLDLVDEGVLSLDSKPHDLLPGFWTQESAVTLRHLLSFTSGFWDEPACVKLGNPLGTLRSCVEAIYSKNVGSAAVPGTQFYYSGTHLQIAGLMAVTAKGVAGWTELFDAFKAKTGLFPTSVYDLPSLSNPRLAGGMTWTGAEYLDFLGALYRGRVLTSASRTELFADQRGAATVAYSPALGDGSGNGLGEDWSYGFGNWLECPTAKTANAFDCGAGHRNSSPGAYGAYPFIDFEHRYFGIVARQGGLGTYPEGVKLLRAIETTAATWAKPGCGG